MITVNILTDNTKKFGLGNFIRSQSLFHELRKRKDLRVNFFVYSKLEKKQYSDILIIDLPKKNYSEKKILKYFSVNKKISLDNSQKWPVDINISIFKKSKFAKRNLVSLKYAIIRKELQKITKSKKNLFYISIGSNDLKNKKHKIKKIFQNYFPVLKNSVNISIKNLKKNTNKLHLKNMRECELAASNGGTTLLELLFQKKIVFVYPQNHEENNFAKFLKKIGHIIFINKFNISKKFIEGVRKKKQKKFIIDNKGLGRISNVIENTLKFN